MEENSSIQNILGQIFIYSLIAGVVILIKWLSQTRYGTKSLTQTKPRNLTIEIQTPFVYLFSWLAVSTLTTLYIVKYAGQESILVYIARSAIGIGFIIIGLSIAKNNFAQGIKGLGLNIKTLFKDIKWAFVNLLAVEPVIILGLVIVEFLGRFFTGTDFEIEKHQSLQTIIQSREILLLIVMFVLITIITPVFEEILFRGIIQSAILSYLGKPWISIFLSSALFTILHPPQHWLAVFALSVAIGYSYEKSGSLIRPIIIHCIFNTANTLIAIYTNSNF